MDQNETQDLRAVLSAIRDALIKQSTVNVALISAALKTGTPSDEMFGEIKAALEKQNEMVVSVEKLADLMQDLAHERT